jgi:hypothetical protein
MIENPRIFAALIALGALVMLIAFVAMATTSNDPYDAYFKKPTTQSCLCPEKHLELVHGGIVLSPPGSGLIR